MQKNVGTLDATLRITCGLTGLAWATARLVQHPDRTTPKMIAWLSAMKVAEGITRYCPMLKLLCIDTLEGKTAKDLFTNSGSNTIRA
ncbi:YgaP family membrane protein [Numidum massiliense]|uniref:YgaP family membrane protein n=1 Tax=Numidum massiliense TaxID=1522315 RepID=UPI00093C1470|nr:DUF2892 domain-containing protein [Numidum massiliense]